MMYIYIVLWLVVVLLSVQETISSNDLHRVKIKYNKILVDKSKARQKPVILLLPKHAKNSSNVNISKRMLTHPALYSDIFYQSFFCSNMAKHNNGKSKKYHVEYDEIWIYKKCFKCDEEEVEGNEERTSSSHVLKQSKHKYKKKLDDNIFDEMDHNNNESNKLHEISKHMINTDLKDIIELASKSPYAMAFFDYTIGKVPPIELIQLSEKNKVKKQRTKIKDVIDGGWQYYSSLKKVKKKMKKISLRRSHIDRWKKDELEFYDHFTKYVMLGKPLFIQKVIDYNNVAFQEQFHRKNFVQNYGGVALYRVNGKKIRISHIVENMRLRQDEFCREMKSTDQHNINNLVVETSNLNLDYSFLNLSYLFNAKGLFIIETNRNNVTLNNKNISHTTMENTTLSIACSLSYKTFQRHSYGMWYLVLFGRRKWILFPPQTNKDYFQQKEKQFNDYFKAKYVSEETVGKDDDNIVELLHMNGLEGLQEQGEVFYIPTGWFYAYINIGETLVLRNTVGNVLSWYNMDNTNKMLQHKCKLPCTIERNDEVAGKDEEN